MILLDWKGVVYDPKPLCTCSLGGVSLLPPGTIPCSPPGHANVGATRLKLEGSLHAPASRDIKASNSTTPETFNYQLPALAAFLVHIVSFERQGHVLFYF